MQTKSISEKVWQISLLDVEEKGFKMSGGHFMPGDIIRTNVTEAKVKDIWERRKIYEQIRAIVAKNEKMS